MKKSTKVAAIALGASAAAAAVARFVSSTNDVPSTPEPVPDPVIEPGIDARAFLDHLGHAVRIDTTVHTDRTRNDPGAMIAMHEFIAGTYPRVAEHCTREIINDQSLLYTWQGSEPSASPVVLMAHMDVVPVEPGTRGDWTVDPFSGAIVDDHLWGRGSLDDKGPLVAILEAVEHLLAEDFAPERTVYLVFGHDEEIGGAEGAQHVARILDERGVRPWFVLDEGGGVVDDIPMMSELPVALVKTAEKGWLSVTLTATGEGGHSSVPPATTAAGTLARALVALESNPMPARVRVLEDFVAAVAPRMDPKVRALLTNLRVTGPAVAKLLGAKPTTDALIRTTTAITMLSAGVKDNVLPQEATAVVNFRILPGDTVDGVLDHIREVVGPDIGIAVYGDQSWGPLAYSSIGSAAGKAVSAAVAETFPEAVVAPWTLTGATDSRYFASTAGDIYGFGPFTLDAGLSGIHGTDERVRISDAERAVSFYCRLIRRATDE
jgi:carboxypeptidase PM20D1